MDKLGTGLHFDDGLCSQFSCTCEGVVVKEEFAHLACQRVALLLVCVRTYFECVKKCEEEAHGHALEEKYILDLLNQILDREALKNE